MQHTAAAINAQHAAAARTSNQDAAANFAAADIATRDAARIVRHMAQVAGLRGLRKIAVALFPADALFSAREFPVSAAHAAEMAATREEVVIFQLPNYGYGQQSFRVYFGSLGRRVEVTVTVTRGWEHGADMQGSMIVCDTETGAQLLAAEAIR